MRLLYNVSVVEKIPLNHVFEGTLTGPKRDDESMCLEMRGGLQDRGAPLQRDGVQQGWKITATPRGEPCCP